ncbi:hypothetical protein AAY473_036887 [Plecturocebus cupreus]
MLAGLELLTSGDPPTSAFQKFSGSIRALYECSGCHLVEFRWGLTLVQVGVQWHHQMRSHYVAQAGLKLLVSSAPPASVSQGIGITGMSHCAQSGSPFNSTESTDYP